MDYSTLQSRVRARLNMGTSDPAAANVDEYVNEAIHYLETAAPDGWPWMRRTVTLTTTASDNTYTFPQISTTPAVAKVLGGKVLRDTVYESLRLMSPDEAEQLFPTTDTGAPEAFFVEGETLYLYPTPDAIYSIPLRVVVTETDLSYDTATPAMPVVFHSAIVEAATMLFYETLQDTTRLQIAEARVDRHISRMRGYGREYRAAPRIRVRNPI